MRDKNITGEMWRHHFTVKDLGNVCNQLLSCESQFAPLSHILNSGKEVTVTLFEKSMKKF